MDIILKLRKAEKEGSKRLVSYYQEQLIIGNENLIQKQINKIGGGGKFESLRQDLAQEGRIALIEALASYDPTMGVAFTTYAVPKIRGAMGRSTRCFQSPVTIPHHVQELRQKIYRYSRDYASEYGKTPSVDQISSYFEENKQKILCVIGSLVPSVAIDSEDSQAEDGTSSSLHEVLYHDNDRMSLLDLDEEIVSKVLEQIEREYSHAHRFILEREYGFNGKTRISVSELIREFPHELYTINSKGEKKYLSRTSVHNYANKATEIFIKKYSDHVGFDRMV